MNPVIGIIGGKGRMGRLFANFFMGKGLKVLISDVGTRSEPKGLANKKTFAQRPPLPVPQTPKLTNKNLVQGSDIVIVSVPIDKTIKVIKEVLPYMKPASAIMDFTSIKEAPVKAMLKGKCEVMGMHPMFGNSNPIPGQTIILCPTVKSKKWSKWMVDFLKENRVKIEKMTPPEHDKTMNIAQGLIHFAEITFADALRRCKLPIRQLLQYTGKASELKIQLAARIIAQDAGLYGSIQIENPYALKSLNQYKKSIDELIKIVKKKDLKAFKRYFDKNKKYFGKYGDEALRDSSILIDKSLELQHLKQKTSHRIKPAKKHQLR